MIPEIGSFYYHYKHDPSGPVNNYAYQVINFAHHTEVDGLEESKMVIYAPLYESAGVYKVGKHWDARPYSMFTEQVTKDGKTFDRFQKITDQAIIDQLVAIKQEMYGN